MCRTLSIPCYIITGLAFVKVNAELIVINNYNYVEERKYEK